MLKMEDDKWDNVSSLQFRNPTIAILLSIGCGTYGADRFYLGDFALGCLKLLCTIILIIAIVAIDVWMLKAGYYTYFCFYAFP